MHETLRPWRSVLYIPGSNERALDKARSLDVDAIIFDLEDAVAPGEKDNARTILADALGQGGYGERARLVRVNGGDTPWGRDDLAAAIDMAPDAILLPKVDSAAQIGSVAAALEAHESCADVTIWAMMETTRGIFNAAEIAQAPRVAGFVLGTNDLAAELGCATGGDRMPLMMALQTCLAAARMGGIVCVDGVFNAFKDDDGLRAECMQGRSLGMDGKTLIHPAQVAICNAVFSPSQDEIDTAKRQIAAFDKAEADGQGVAVLDGRIVENLHVASARKILAKAGS